MVACVTPAVEVVHVRARSLRQAARRARWEMRPSHVLRVMRVALVGRDEWRVELEVGP